MFTEMCCLFTDITFCEFAYQECIAPERLFLLIWSKIGLEIA